MLRYLDRFYGILESERRTERELYKQCIGKPAPDAEAD